MTPNIQMADVGGFLWIMVAIVVIASKIFKLAKGGESTPRNSTADSASADELEAFLKGLTQQPTKPAQPEQPPPLKRAPEQKRTIPLTWDDDIAPPQPKPQKVATARKTKRRRKQSVNNQLSAPPAQQRTPSARKSWARARKALPSGDLNLIRALVRDRDSIRTSIVLREVLGPPKALR